MMEDSNYEDVNSPLSNDANMQSAIDLVIPPDGKWFAHDDEAWQGWYAHEQQQWMYNEKEGIYFHIESQMVVAAGDEVPKNLVPLRKADEYPNSASDESDNTEHADGLTLSPSPDDSSDPEEYTDNELGIDFEKDLRGGTICRKGNSEQKEHCEDFYVTQECLSIHLVSNSDALCYYSAVFDGHCGYKCAEYLTKHLKNNILSVYRQAVRTMGTKNSQIDSYPVESIEVRALMQGCAKAFEMTDNNFCNVAKKYDLMDGSTATVALIYGPDEEGDLKLITAHVGDSRAILCSMTANDECFAQPMTSDHKPNSLKERQYIEKNGGTVEFAQGAWRCVARLPNGNMQGSLATSRAFGDYLMKYPKRVLSSEPDVSVYTMNLASDIFLVLVTDGITAVLSNQQIIEIVCEAIDEACTPEAAAERIVHTAEKLGSYDDKTCTVIYFGWHRELFDKCVRDRQEDAIREARPPGDAEENPEAAEMEEDMFAS